MNEATRAGAGRLGGARRRLHAALLSLGCAGACGALLLSAAAATADLPDGRAYEQVSPVDKNGFAVNLSGFRLDATADGNRAVFGSFSPATSEATHGMPISLVADRGPDGWVSRVNSPTPVNPNYNAVNDRTVLQSYSNDLTVGAMATEDAFDPTDLNSFPLGDVNAFGMDAYIVHPDGTVELASRGNGPERLGFFGLADGPYVAGDGSRTLFVSDASLVPEDATRGSGVDVYARAQGQTYLLSAMSDGQSHPCGAALAKPPQLAVNPSDRLRPISQDGSHVYFMTAGEACSEADRLFVRLGTQPSIEVSASRRTVPDPGGPQDVIFANATADGDVVVFFSNEMLTDDAPVDGGYYRYTVSSDELEYVVGMLPQRVTPDSNLGRDHVMALSPDGERILFARFGTPNRLMVNEGGVSTEITAIQTLQVEGAAEFSDDGERAVVRTAAALTPDDTDAVDPTVSGPYDVYLYDYSANSVDCLSCPPAGTPSSPVDAELGWRPMSGDGEYVFFQSPDPLTAGDANSVDDVYRYRDGELALISSGRGAAPSKVITASESGRDVFFVTSDSLLGQDRDGGSTDLYDARIGGGFAEPGRGRDECSGDACQGRATVGPDGPAVGSRAFRGARNAAPERAAAALGRVSLAGRARGRSAVLRIRVGSAGRIAVSGAGIRTVGRSLSRAATYRVRVRLKPGADRGTTRLRVVFRAESGARSVKTLRVTFERRSGR